jgi:thioredoxin-related protein
MKKRFVLSLLIIVMGYTAYSQVEVSKVKWYTIDEALKLNEKSPKKIFIDLYTDWCGWCKTMDKNTFSDPKIAEYLNKNFYPVKNSGTQARSPHDLAVALTNGQLSYPTVVYLDGANKLLTAVPGYMTPVDIEPILTFFAEDYYKTTKWEDFKAKFVSKLK